MTNRGDNSTSTPGAAVDRTRIEELLGRLVEALAPKEASAAAEEPVALRTEYQVAVEIIKLLSELRFQCLVFVTSITAVAGALLPQAIDPGTRPAIGVLGLLATLGITVYELRNSQLYEAAVHRAKWLEGLLGMQRSLPGAGIAGLFAERPPYVRDTAAQGAQRPLMHFWFVPVKHDHGLALIYGAALGAWVYLAVYGLLALPAPAHLWSPVSVGQVQLISAVLGVVAGACSIGRFIVHDRNRLKKPLPAR